MAPNERASAIFAQMNLPPIATGRSGESRTRWSAAYPMDEGLAMLQEEDRKLSDLKRSIQVEQGGLENLVIKSNLAHLTDEDAKTVQDYVADPQNRSQYASFLVDNPSEERMQNMTEMPYVDETLNVYKDRNSSYLSRLNSLNSGLLAPKELTEANELATTGKKTIKQEIRNELRARIDKLVKGLPTYLNIKRHTYRKTDRSLAYFQTKVDKAIKDMEKQSKRHQEGELQDASDKLKRILAVI